MAHHSLSFSYTDISLMLSVSLVILWLWLCGRSLRGVLEHAALSLSGHLRPRPDQELESALRTAFTQLDEELAVILANRPAVRPHH